MSTRNVPARISCLRFAVVLLFVCAPFVGLAQDQMQDVVYLKSGSIIRGDIIEQIPNQTIKIKTSDGSVFVYAMSDIKKITKEQRVAVARAAFSHKPLGGFAAVFNPLGFLQFGPMLQAEFKVAPNIMVGPHMRFLGLGLATRAVSDYKEFNTSSMAFGIGVKYFFGELDAQDRFVGALFVEYGSGGGTNPKDVFYNGAYVDAVYKYSYMGFYTNFGYRWRFSSPFFIGLGLMAGVASETEDYRSSPTRKDYLKATRFFGMLEFNIGYEN